MLTKLTSNYLAAAQKMRGVNKRRRIVAYVESYDDVLFWRNVLAPLEDETRYFEVMLPNIDRKLERGKKSAIAAMALNNQLGEFMIACVDADYDYLAQGCTSSSAGILSQPFVFHTYAYSIENLQCYAPGLHSVCVMATLNDHALFDFEHFLRSYSAIVYPLFVWNVWHYRTGRYSDFSVIDLCRQIEVGKVMPHNADEQLAGLKSKVDKKVRAMERQHADHIGEWRLLDTELRERLGVLPEETYLYIQGHFLFDRIVTPLAQRVCAILVREQENEIRRKACHATQARNELSCYSHSIQDVAQMLKKNTSYTASSHFRAIQASITAALQNS